MTPPRVAIPPRRGGRVNFVPERFPLRLYLGFYSQGETRLHLDSPGRGKDDGAHRLFVAALPVQQ